MNNVIIKKMILHTLKLTRPKSLKNTKNCDTYSFSTYVIINYFTLLNSFNN